jgi:uncharacterized membrane protein (DUF485 family)
MRVGFFELLTIVLISAKVFGFATYGWFTAFSPLIVGFVLGVIYLLMKDD